MPRYTYEMRLGFGVLALALLLFPTTATAIAGPTAWNTTISGGPDGTKKKVVFFGEHPDVMLRACRCIAGTWQIARRGETARAFAGTLSSPSPNHARAAKRGRFTVKVRRTRELDSIAPDYRADVYSILRGKGELVLREVQGNEWEVVGYALQSVGDLFGNNARWRADPAPKPAKPSPFADPAKDAVALADAINEYRASLGLPKVPISPALTKVARAHVRDLGENKPVTETCNMHSWSTKGAWSGCCYDKSRAASKCMWVKPKEIANFRGKGYEIAASASGVTPAKALELWKKSPAHHDVMINRGIWSKPWRSLGVALDGDYAVAWFAEEADR